MRDGSTLAGGINQRRFTWVAKPSGAGQSAKETARDVKDEVPRFYFTHSQLAGRSSEPDRNIGCG